MTNVWCSLAGCMAAPQWHGPHHAEWRAAAWANPAAAVCRAPQLFWCDLLGSPWCLKTRLGQLVLQSALPSLHCLARVGDRWDPSEKNINQWFNDPKRKHTMPSQSTFSLKYVLLPMIPVTSCCPISLSFALLQQALEFGTLHWPKLNSKAPQCATHLALRLEKCCKAGCSD